MRALVLAVLVLAAVPASASALDDAGYWAFADRMQAPIDRHWNDDAGLFNGFSAGAHADVLLTYAVAAAQGHEGPARNDRRARRLVDVLVASPPFVEHPPGAREAGARARVRELGQGLPGPPAPRRGLRGDRRIALRVDRPPRARPQRAPGRRDPRPHPPHRAGRLLALAGHPAQPDQLVRAGLCRERDRHRQPAVAAARPAAADRALRGAGARHGRRRGQPRRRAALQLSAALPGGRPEEHRLGRVREHHGLLHARVRAGAPGRDGGAVAGRPAAAAGVADARARRLLDPRRLPQLGHGLRLRALAPGQEARAQPAGADRDRLGAVAGAAQRTRLGEVDARPRLRRLRAPSRPQRR